ncbi:LRR receptor-like serine/threonine-protein kinase GSO2 [Momordica charantia]|uniref:LRR receptor-like serine/threonine-protein kinase GSO2 n=1 Tax=Momordica charantia TaxID=3673 RepID=A0A6J1CH67_MOMCH|nr:LRR receptor-like serine/threonine-protein kinase GSO2 [Momordica charantia]
MGWNSLRWFNRPAEAEWITSENYTLKGNLSDSIVNLRHVSRIDLSYNDFGGIQIPSFLGSLVSLNYLNLTGSGFQGLIPHQLGNLSNLQQLGLRGKSPFSGPKLYSENLHWLQGLGSLLSLDLSYANLSKASDWLLEINKLPSLVELRLSNCELSHITPLNHVNFTSLSVLDISSNNFNAFLPKWISNLGSLVSLDLSRSDFEGPLPRGFSNLTSLQNLNLEHNFLNSSLPEWLFSLKSITSMTMGLNEFEGPIPCANQNLSALTYLDLSDTNINYISTIPSCLYSLHNLQYLILRTLFLQGEISEDIVNLTNLVSLDLSSNILNGSIPSSIGTLSKLRSISLSGNSFRQKLSQVVDIFSAGCLGKSLRYLDLRGNFISGPIPESIGNLSSLEILDLSRNELNEILPKSMGSLSSLKELSIAYNRLEGIVSEIYFINLVNLTKLYMSGNNLTLSFSIGWIPPFNLGRIYLRSCNLGPQFPKWLKSQKNLYELDLSHARISDTVPYWFWSFSTSCSYLNLSHNQLFGKIPHILLNSPSSMVYLSSNKFDGDLPRVSSNVIELDLSNNSFFGNMSHFLCHSRSQENQLKILYLGDNLLSGNIPDCWTKWMSLKVVKLDNNNLFGKLPSSMGSLNDLQSLHLRNNSLSGEIPSALKNCLSLWTLDLGLNAFQGNIPTWIGTNLSNLKVLGLRSNKLSGLIPDELCNLSSLQIMDIGNNTLTGSIPHCFGNFTAMATKRSSFGQIFYSFYYGEFLENAFVITKGEEFQYNNILTLMTSMDLSSNKLSGEIPHEITSLLGLRSLNLSRNNLRGSIPQQIGSMTNMESLDFSRNQLSGQIPTSMSKLTFLNHLNLSHNNLSGPIPTSTQLQGLDPSSFIGNELCGPPLTNSCKREKRTTPETKNGEAKEDDEKYIDEWFYLSLAIGFVVGFWGIWGPLFISKSWRHTYFRRLNSLWHKFNC